jgi:hypothetical protein
MLDFRTKDGRSRKRLHELNHDRINAGLPAALANAAAPPGQFTRRI